MRADDPVAQSLGIIREYYALGSRVPDREYGKMTGAAEKLQLNIDYMRACRRFAQLYTAKQLDQLCAACEAGGYAIGWARMMLLLKVRAPAGRTSLLNEAIKKKWSKSELEAEIRRRYGVGRQPGAGRPTKLRADSSPEVAYIKALELCSKFSSFMSAMRRLDEGGASCVLKKIPPATRTWFERAERSMADLRGALVTKVPGATDNRPSATRK